MRCTYFRLQRNFLCYMPNYPYIFCKAFLLPIYSILNGIFAICSHFPHIYVHTLERQLHAIYSHIFTFIWKAISCCTFIGKAIFVLLIHTFERQFRHTFLFWEAFLCHIQHICTFAKHLATYSTYVCFICMVFASCYLIYIHMYMVNNILTPSRYKEFIMVQHKPSAGQKGIPHQHALLFMPSCIQNQRLGFLGLSHILAFTLTSACCPYIQKMATIYAQTQSISNIHKLMPKCH